MPATYTYNDALEDAVRVVVKAWEETSDYAAQMPFMLNMLIRLTHTGPRVSVSSLGDPAL
jgi:hypothetical protein